MYLTSPEAVHLRSFQAHVHLRSFQARIIRLCYHYNRERVRVGTCYIQHVPSCEQRAYLFTNALDLTKHTYLSSQIMGFQ